MKTAISIPDNIYKASMKAAKKLGISRSELYVKAVAEYLEGRFPLEVTKALDEVYLKEPSHLDYGLSRIQAHSLEKEDW